MRLCPSLITSFISSVRSLKHALVLVTAAISFSSHAQETYQLEKNEEPPEAVYGVQRIQNNKNPNEAIEIITIEGSSPEAVLDSFNQAKRQLSVESQKAGVRVTGAFQSPQDAKLVNQALSLTGQSIVSRSFYAAQPKNSSQGLKNAANAGPSRSIAGGGKRRSRMELLVLHDSLGEKISSRAKELSQVGDGIVKQAFDRSGSKWFLVAFRTVIGGGGMTWGLTIANIHPVTTVAMGLSSAVVSFVTQMNLDNLGDFFSYVGKLEKWVLNTLVFKPLGWRWTPAEKQESTIAANFAKWYAIEVGLSETSKIAGLTAHTLVSDAQTVVNGVAQIPHQFAPLTGLEDSLVLSVDTLVSQGVYETIFNHEFNKRNQPYHELIGYYLELSKQTTDAALLAEYQSIIDDCIHLGKGERTFRAILANIGTATWIAALALQSHPQAWISKAASYSILSVAAGLKVFYSIRNTREKAEFAKLVGLIAEENLARIAKNGQKKSGVFTRICQGAVKKGRGVIDGFKEWREEFASELVPLTTRAKP